METGWRSHPPPWKKQRYAQSWVCCCSFSSRWKRESSPLQSEPISSAGLSFLCSTPLQSALSFFLPPPMGTLLTTAEPTAVTPPATAHTPPFTSPAPMTGTATTVLTAVLVRSRLFPPIQVTPPTVAPKAPFVTPYNPPANLPNIPGCATGWSLLPSV